MTPSTSRRQMIHCIHTCESFCPSNQHETNLLITGSRGDHHSLATQCTMYSKLHWSQIDLQFNFTGHRLTSPVQFHWSQATLALTSSCLTAFLSSALFLLTVLSNCGLSAVRTRVWSWTSVSF